MNRPIAIEDLALRLPTKARLDRPRPRSQDDRTCGLGRRAAPRLAAENAAARSVPEGRRRADRAFSREFEIAGVILGLPLDLEGRAGPRAQSTRAFARNLATRTDLPIAYLGRAFFDRGRHPLADRKRRLPSKARRGRRQDGRRLHPAGRARPALALTRGSGRTFVSFFTVELRRGTCFFERESDGY